LAFAHLGRIYRKLDIRTRTQLARRLASQPAEADRLVDMRD